MLCSTKEDRINNHLVFLSKVFVHTIEQRFSYWVVNLGFFLSNQTVYERTFDLGKKNNVWIYFNFRKYFFSFLLLKLFLNFTAFKSVHKRVENYRKKSKVFFKQKNIKGSSRTAVYNNKNIFKNTVNSKTLTLKNFKVLFLMTIPAQKLFVDKVFLSQTKHLSILVDQNLITNRYFFYKILLGFHKERKNMIYPQFAKRFSSSINNFYSSLGFSFFSHKFNTFFISKFANFKIEALASGLNKNFFLVKNYLIRFNFVNQIIFFKYNNNFISTENAANTTANNKNYFINLSMFFNNYLVDFFNFFFIGVVNCFWGLFWVKFFFKKDLITWRNFSIKYFKDFTEKEELNQDTIFLTQPQVKPLLVKNKKKNILKTYKKYFFNSNYFFSFMQNLSFKYFNKVISGISTIKNFYLNNFNQRLLQQVFIEKSFIRQDPKKLKDRQALLDKIILLRFLPITLVVLFVSAVNKQIFRDVFKMNLPFILVSSMDNKNFPSDYSFPGNSFEFNILYFYFKFFLEFFKV